MASRLLTRGILIGGVLLAAAVAGIMVTLAGRPGGQPTPADVRAAVMEYIARNHPDAAQFIRDLRWTGGRVTPEGLVGAETYRYESQNGWIVTITYPVVPTPVFRVTADFSITRTEGYIGIMHRILWTGTFHSGVSETSYEHAV